MRDTVDFIIEYESGQLSPQQILEGFSDLIKDGVVWQLQGHYGRTAQHLIDEGYLDKQGNILKEIG